MNKKVRVRFAPSPTGALHMGGVRTALFNYLFAKQHGGSFILRIEDTDSARFVEGAEEYIIEALEWCGITFDEGVSKGGVHAPYRQSERKDIYLKYAEELVEKGHAYYAFDTSEELNKLREDREAKGETYIYNYELRKKCKTSLSLAKDEVEKLKKEHNNWVIRFKIPENETLTFSDIIRGEITVNTNTLDDKVLWKRTDELPTYHLANIVDDHLMQISHVIRGEEWLPSLPLHILLYKAFNWESTQPQFAHLSLLLKPDGKGKLSKRDGDKLGFPVFPLEWKSGNDVSRGYREDGYFPEAFVNMLALLGWNPGTNDEIFSLEELIPLFSLDRVIKSGARFNPDKAKWFNQQYLKMKSDEELAGLYKPILQAKGFSNIDNCFLIKVCFLIKERATFIHDFWDLSSFFFTAPTFYNEKAVGKFWKEDASVRMEELYNIINSATDFSPISLEESVHNWIEKNELKMGQIMNSFRISIVGDSKGPNMFEIVCMIGKEETLKRLKTAIEQISI